MSLLNRLYTLVYFTFIVVVFTTCGGHGSTSVPLSSPAPVLLFNGTGTSANDVAALEVILNNNYIKYSLINSSELNAMGEAQITKYRLLIVPGGNFIDMGKSLTTQTASNIRNAVQQGLNYCGICAGAFLAGKSDYYNGFDLANQATFKFYAAVNKGISKAAVPISSPNTPTTDQYWENGPQLSGWGNIVAKYPDGMPTVTEGKSGAGFVILTGIHAEAPEYWRGQMRFNTSADVANIYASKLVNAALQGKELQHY